MAVGAAESQLLRVLEDPFAGGGEVVDHDGVAELVALVFLGGAAVAGAHEQASGAAGVPAGFEIDELVADDVAPGEVEIEVLGGLLEEGGRGFASAARLIGGFRGDVEAVEGHVFGGEFRLDVGVDAIHVGHGEVTAADAGLVGDDEEEEAGFLQAAQGFGRAGDELHLLGFVEIVFVGDERAVAVEEDGG